MAVALVNLKDDHPNVEVARARLQAALASARASGTIVVKIIHGYGSSGAGGAIKRAVHRSLTKRRREGQIRCFVPGERWELFDEQARLILAECREAERDPDINRYNEGITLVLL